MAVHSVGICGSDVHYWTHGEIGDFVVRAPMLLGHESAGTVTKLGSGVKNLQIGQLHHLVVSLGTPSKFCQLRRLRVM